MNRLLSYYVGRLLPSRTSKKLFYSLALILAIYEGLHTDPAFGVMLASLIVIARAADVLWSDFSYRRQREQMFEKYYMN